MLPHGFSRMLMLQKIEDRICFVLQALIGAILLVLVVLNCVQVVTRYFVSVVIVWLEEATILGVYWMAAFGIPLLTFKDEHLLMDITGKILPGWLKTAVEWAILAFSGVAAVGFIACGSLAYSINKGFSSSIIGFDESFRYVPLIVLGILMSVAVVFRVVNTIKKAKSGEEIYK